MSYDEIVITVVIIAIVLFTAWRGGQANPVGTGKIARRLTVLESTVAQQGTKVDALDKGLGEIAQLVKKNDENLGAIRIELAGDRGLTERTWAAVDRLQQFFIQDSFDRRNSK